MPMKKTSTLNGLTKFIDAEEKLISENLRRKQEKSGPKTSILNSILGYSKALEIQESDDIGQLELVLN